MSPPKGNNPDFQIKADAPKVGIQNKNEISSASSFEIEIGGI